MKYSFAVIALLLTSVSSTGLSRIATAQPIFNISPSAKPGEAINLQGDFGNPVTAYMSVDNSTTAIQMPVRVQGNGQVTAEVPPTVPLGLYKVWVKNPGQSTAGPASYVNQAWGMHFDSPEVKPGGALRIYGRNLMLPGAAPAVRFRAQGTTGAGVAATVTPSGSDAYVLNITAPDSLTTDTVYDVFVTNGFGGSTAGSIGETLVEQPVKAIANGGDSFGLGVPWAAKFTFASTQYDVTSSPFLLSHANSAAGNNDQPAIQAAIDYASSHGGGVVYLPSGTYDISTPASQPGSGPLGGIVLRSNVVLKGAGKGQTFVKYGYGSPNFYWGIVFATGSVMGISDMSIQNINQQGNWYHNMIALGGVTDIFLNNINYNYGGEAIVLNQGLDRLLIKESSLTSRYVSGLGSLSQGPLTLSNIKNVVFRSNVITHEVGQTGFNNGVRNVVMEGNQFLRDAAMLQGPNPVILDTRTLSLNFAKNVAILNNHFETINGAAFHDGDGETILSEGGGPASSRPDASVGSFGSPNWGSPTSDAVVVVINGKGRGQWRQINSVSSTGSLNLNENWSTTPDSGSTYTVTNWSAQNWLVKDNTMLNNRAGLEIWDGSAVNIAWVHNDLTNNDGLLLRPSYRVEDGKGIFTPILNVQIVDNTVRRTSASPYPYVPAYIGITATQTDSVSTAIGTEAYGIEIRNNTIEGDSGYQRKTTFYYPNNNWLNEQGYYSFYFNEHAGTSNGIPITLGTIFQNNKATNLKAAHYLNNGSFNTFICNTTRINTPQLVDDWTGGPFAPTPQPTSTNTQVCPHTFTPNQTVGLKARFYPRANLAFRMQGGRFEGSNDNSNWNLLGTINFTRAANQWSELQLGSTLYQYLRYVSPSDFHCNVAELEFWNGTTKLIGTPFGTAPYQVGSEYNKAYDGDTGTFFDALTPSNGYTGINLGTTALKARFYPRANMAFRMQSGRFEGINDNTNWNLLGTINGTPAASQWSELALGSPLYPYLRYVSPPDFYCNVAELEFWNGTTKLTGTPFGTAPYQAGSEYGKAYDGDTGTFFDSFTPSNGYTGLSLN